MDKPPTRPGWTIAGVAFLLLILVLQLALSVRQQSQTIDEGAHIWAGYRYWQCADYGMNNEHPPLLKLVAAFPLLLMRLQEPTGPCGFTAIEAEFSGARKFLYANDEDAILFRVRLASSIFTLLLAALLFEVAYRMFGAGPAFLALLLLIFDPNVLAHGALVATDVVVACCLLAAVYAFYRYTKAPTAWNLFAAGFMAGLTLVAKHSGILVFPILGALALAELWLRCRANGQVNARREALRLAGVLVIVAVVALVVVWAFYGFRFAARPYGQKTFPAESEAQLAQQQTAQRQLIGPIFPTVLSTHVLPEAYLEGLRNVLDSAALGKRMFLLGKLYPSGRWFYFPAAMLMKSTLAFLLLLAIAPAATQLYRGAYTREILFLLIPAGVFFAAAVIVKINIGMRHIISLYVLLMVLVAAAAWTLARQRRVWAYVVAVLLAAHTASSLRAFPDYLPYANEAWGGSTQVYRLLSDSSADWGQGLKAVKAYLERKGITDCWLAYYGNADPGYYHIPCKRLPDGLGNGPFADIPQAIRGTVLIGASELTGRTWEPGEHPYGAFEKIRPSDNIAGSTLVYQGQFDTTLASAMNHQWRSQRFAKEEHWGLALDEARKAVALAPRSPETRYNLGRCLAYQSQTAEARAEYQTALALAQSDHADFYKSLIRALRRELARSG